MIPEATARCHLSTKASTFLPTPHPTVRTCVHRITHLLFLKGKKSNLGQINIFMKLKENAPLPTPASGLLTLSLSYPLSLPLPLMLTAEPTSQSGPFPRAPLPHHTPDLPPMPSSRTQQTVSPLLCWENHAAVGIGEPRMWLGVKARGQGEQGSKLTQHLLSALW